ncbi:MAG: hypothetical protein IJP98_04250 [Clostridia bacterium]|nr:hypothetical protein [Clostridia bacterium]
MKLLGIALLFVLCVAAGFGKAARIEARERALRSVYRDIEALLLQIRTRRLPLDRAAELLPDGIVKRRVTGEKPQKGDPLTETETERLDRFLSLLQRAAADEIAAAGEGYRSELALAIEEAQRQTQNTRLFRSVGALSGAVLAVLLW